MTSVLRMCFCLGPYSDSEIAQISARVAVYRDIEPAQDLLAR
jgi:hypothetical protein